MDAAQLKQLKFKTTGRKKKKTLLTFLITHIILRRTSISIKFLFKIFLKIKKIVITNFETNN